MEVPSRLHPLTYDEGVASTTIQFSENIDFNTILQTCYYTNPHVPWSNAEMSAASREHLATPAVRDFVEENFDRFIDVFKQNVLAAKPQSRPSGLRPQLGFSSIGASLTEEDVRQTWKSSSKVLSLSICWFLIDTFSESTISQYWLVVTSFILNVLDDSEPILRTHAGALLLHFVDRMEVDVLSRSGLLPIFTSSVKISLSFLPPSTPAETSLKLFSVSYPVLYKLVLLDSDPNTKYLQIISENVLLSIAHVRSNREDYDMKVQLFLIRQLKVLIQHVKWRILVSVAKVNFMLNNIIINPFLVDSKKGLEVVQACVEAQAEILSSFLDVDTEGITLLLEHRYNFLGAWTVALQHVNKIGSPKVTKTVKVATDLLQLLCQKADLDLDLTEIYTSLT